LKPARNAVVHLEPDVSSLAAARRFVTATLEEWRVDESRIDRAQLVATELVANAIVHACSAPVLSLVADGSELVLRVADKSRGRPVTREPTTDAAGGRGLLMVEALGNRWGVDENGPGKVVWVAFEGAFP
jgi:anti-sigma regulatory factor (Ser/Thr protein kinase)